jgi:(1->4)-alpha-D-glucan 1-alpha-D-glucosylmutase
MERDDVFAETHRLIFELIRAGKVTGLRIDHADGLWNPAGYLGQLQRSIFKVLADRIFEEQAGPEDSIEASDDGCLLDQYDAQIARNPSDPIARPFWIVVEKILNQRESLATGWPVNGTTGYDFANAVNGLFVNSAARKAFTDIYASFVGNHPSSYPDLVNSTKKIIMLVSLSSEINELAFGLKRIAWKNRWYRDLTLNSLTHALREIIAAFPVYRTYLTGDGAPIAPHDLQAIDQAVAEAMRRNPRTSPEVFEFIRKVLLQQVPDDATNEDREEWTNLAMRVQQTTSPVMAKGVEDTAFYVYNRLASLNDVGSDPEQFGVSVFDFHQQNAARQASWPHALLTTSTHDSKRSADVRARIDVLSEMPRAWRAAIGRWSRMNRLKKTLVQGTLAPDRNDEYLLYQTLIGAWPAGDLEAAELAEFHARIKQYMQKATREAKVHGSWLNPNVAYDNAMDDFIDRLLAGRRPHAFLADFAGIRDTVAFYGMLNSLSMRLLQATSPGVPDIYQGDELWSYALVDPDNRRPVDFDRPARLLAELDARLAPPLMAAQAGTTNREGARPASEGERGGPRAAPRTAGLVADLLDCWTDGRIKLYVTRQALEQRRKYPDVFTTGAYRPLESVGTKRDHTVAFARSNDDVEFVVATPRLVVGLTAQSTDFPLGDEIWDDTALDVGDEVAGEIYENVLTGEQLAVGDRDGRFILRLGEIFKVSPVALLRRER